MPFSLAIRAGSESFGGYSYDKWFIFVELRCEDEADWDNECDYSVQIFYKDVYSKKVASDISLIRDYSEAENQDLPEHKKALEIFESQVDAIMAELKDRNLSTPYDD